jgi:hypothetical protein
MFSKRFFINHKVSFAILLFLLFFGTIHLVKPNFVYYRDGGFRPFGIGYQNKTILPIWLVAILLAILSYIIVASYTSISYGV